MSTMSPAIIPAHARMHAVYGMYAPVARYTHEIVSLFPLRQALCISHGVYFITMNMRQPVVLTLIAAAILVLAGLYFVERQRAITPLGTGETWNSGSGYVATEETSAASDSTTPLPDITTNTGPDTLVIPKGTSATSAPVAKAPVTDGVFDYNAMLDQLRREGAIFKGSEQANSTYNDMVDAFSIGPSVTAVAETIKPRTAKEEAVFEYGNRIGRYVQGFAAVNPNMGQTLTDQINHRNNKTYGDPVRDLGDRYKALGESILAMHDIPPDVEQAHKKLGQSYVDLGVALRAVPDSVGDQELLAAITAYNNKADAYTRSFVAMVALFSALNVSFEQSDPGSAFTFRR